MTPFRRLDDEPFERMSMLKADIAEFERRMTRRFALMDIVFVVVVVVAYAAIRP